MKATPCWLNCHSILLKLCVLLIFTCLSLPSDARSLADIKKSKELRVCLNADHPAVATPEPAQCRENCKLSGPLYEQAKAFVDAMGNGVRGKFLRIKWEEMFANKEGKTDREASYTPELLATEKCDLFVTNMTKNAWRLKKMDIVTLQSGRMMVIISKPAQGKIKTIDDLAGKTVSIEKDTSYQTWLQQQNETTWHTNPVNIKVAPTQASLLAVDAAEIDFTIVDSDIAIWVARHQLKNAKIAFPVGPIEELGWAFRKQDKDLQAIAQKFFAEQRENEASAFNQIWQRHFGISLNKFVSVIQSTK